MRNRFLFLPVVTLLLFWGTRSPGHAQIYAKLASVTSNGNGYTYTYDLSLASGATVQYGDFVTIYDCRSLIPGTNFQPVGWTFSSSDLGKTPSHIRATDSSSYPNLTWMYAGSATLGPGPLDIGNFGVNATSGSIIVTDYASQAHLYAPGEPGNNKLMYLLSYTGGAHAAAPSRRWWALLPVGLLPLGLLLRARRL